MNRRKFGLFGASTLALTVGLGKIRSAKAAADPSLLTTTLMPFGGTRAGNAEGTIPAWTGGLTQIPPGWTPGGLFPDFFASDAKVVSIDSSNMAQYKDKLADGVMLMMQKWGYRIDVYPTHRTFSAPQYVYDNAVKNVTTAQPAPQGYRYGFVNAYGAVPFPILDPDPMIAGAQAMLNHGVVYEGEGWTRDFGQYLVDESGNVTLGVAERESTWYTYYRPDGTVANSTGVYQLGFFKNTAPASLVGQELVYQYPTNVFHNPERIWQYLPGQGRVREDPNLLYDTPAPALNDYANQDEYGVFAGAIDRYDWKHLGVKEIYVPYNNNKLILSTAAAAHQRHFIDPDLVRWELHRVHIVEGTVASGSRDVIARRRYYLDEDSWLACLGDTYDAQGNYWRHDQLILENRPDFPAGVIPSTVLLYDLQANRYASLDGIWNEAPYNANIQVGVPPMSLFNPQSMAAQAQF
jgi:hypothetical protein